MNEFDLKASGWDSNPMHTKRSEAVAEHIRLMIPLKKTMNVLEFGAGTGITSMLLLDYVKQITMMDNSEGMVQMMNNKILKTGAANLKAVHFDLEIEDFTDEKFDLIFSQMVLHHVTGIQRLIDKFSVMLNPGGFLAVADLYPEDGSFHGKDFNGHKGFDPDQLGRILERHNFSNISHRKCFTIEKETEEGTGNFDVFILTAQLNELINNVK
ncbi:MAG: class I SAM-dependent methyltransferase [Chloroflexota bacterium]